MIAGHSEDDDGGRANRTTSFSFLLFTILFIYSYFRRKRICFGCAPATVDPPTNRGRPKEITGSNLSPARRRRLLARRQFIRIYETRRIFTRYRYLCVSFQPSYTHVYIFIRILSCARLSESVCKSADRNALLVHCIDLSLHLIDKKPYLGTF